MGYVGLGASGILSSQMKKTIKIVMIQGFSALGFVRTYRAVFGS